MEHLTELVRNRKSIRTFDGQRLTREDQEKLEAFMANLENPYNIPIECRFLDGREQILKCPAVSGTRFYVGGKGKCVPHLEEAFGYSFELLVLYAQSLGIGTVWIGADMDRPSFEPAMELTEDEITPCMSPLGYPAERMSMRENIIRRGIRSDTRKDFDAIFFDGSFDTPLTPEKAGRLAHPLEMVRWAPSAVNGQPWRVVVKDNGVHFYLRHTKGFISKATGDLQKVDMGVALCHFALAAEEDGLDVLFGLSDPGIAADSETEYIASYLVSTESLSK